MNGEVNKVILILRRQLGYRLPETVWKDRDHAAAFRRWLCRQARWNQKLVARNTQAKRRALWRRQLRDLGRLIELVRIVLVDGYDLSPDEVGRPLATLEALKAFAEVRRAVDNDPRFARFRRCP